MLDGRIYIGQRKYSGNPLEDKYFGSGIYLKNAINKYGKENFKKEIVEVVGSLEELNERETFWIEKEKSYLKENGFNISTTAQPYSWQFIATEERKKEWKEKIKKNHHNVKGENNPMYGKTHTEEVRKRLSVFRTGFKHSEETKRKIAKKGKDNPMYGRSRKGEFLGEKNGYSKQVVVYNKNTKEEMVCNTISELCERLKISRSTYNYSLKKRNGDLNNGWIVKQATLKKERVSTIESIG